MRGDEARQRRAAPHPGRRGVVRVLLRPPRGRAAGLLRPPHAGRRACRRPDRRDVRGRAHRPPPVPAREGRGRRMAVRHRVQEARRRPAARLRREPGAAAARHGAHRAHRRGRPSHREPGRRRIGVAARRAARARPARRGRRARRRRAQLRRDRGPAGDVRGGRPQAGEPRAAHRSPADRRPRMSADFTARLQMQLHDAALREERRGALSRTLVAARPRPAVVLGAVAAAVVAALVVVFATGLGAPEPEPATPPAPRVIANVAVAGQITPGAPAAAFGSVWLSDANGGDVVRVDHRTRRVTARVRVGGEASLAAATGSLWALVRPRDALVRIDPRSNRVTARIPLNGTFGNSALVPAGPRVWAIGQNGAAAVDTARGRVVARIRYSAAGFQLVDAFTRRGELWMTSADGTVRRYDARTGRPLGRLPWK